MYHSHFKDKGEDQSRIVSFVQNPTKDRALMMDAVRKYGLMPSVRLGEDEIQNMYRYIQEHEFGLATGIHSSLSNPDSLNNVLVQDEFVKMGHEIAMQNSKLFGFATHECHQFREFSACSRALSSESFYHHGLLV